MEKTMNPMSGSLRAASPTCGELTQPKVKVVRMLFHRGIERARRLPVVA
jgi:hypothetical protein